MILVVDDHADTVGLVVRMLERNGHAAVGAAGGVEALEFLRRAEPDVVILDCDMPRVDGLAVLRAIRADPRLADTPVVLFTANATPGDEYAALGVQGYAAKDGAGWGHLVRFVNRHVSPANPPGPPAGPPPPRSD
jgi:CheY-like chemotaxis protein